MQSHPVQPLAYDTGSYLWGRDLSHLRTLAICHFVWGGLSMLFSSIFIIHIVLGALMVSGALPTGKGQPPPPPAMGWFFIATGGCVVLFGWTVGVLVIYSGVCLRARKHWVFSIVIAGISCLSVPLGTLLGVFTLIVLNRESVKALYGRYNPPMMPPGAVFSRQDPPKPE